MLQCGWPSGGQEHIHSSCWGTWSQTRGETSLPPLLPRPEWGKRSCVQELGAPWARNALPLPACASLYPVSSDTCGPATQGRRSAVMGRGEGGRRAAVENGWPFCPVIRRPFLLFSKVPVLPGHPRAAPCTCASAAAHPRSSAPRRVPEELRPRPSFRSCLASPPEARRPRKRVVFADTKGPSLTSVHRFEDAQRRTPAAGPAARVLHSPAHQSQASRLRAAPPRAGLRDLGRRLQTPRAPGAVRGAGGLLRGAVRARGLGFQKVLQVRIALDAWGLSLKRRVSHARSWLNGQHVGAVLPRGPPRRGAPSSPASL